jgi:hypothetical protein
MSDDKDKQRSEAEAKIEEEIRLGRKFTMEEAIGRMVGPRGDEGDFAGHANAAGSE